MALNNALSVMLRAHVGATLPTQVLSFNIGALAPPLILAGLRAEPDQDLLLL